MPTESLEKQTSAHIIKFKKKIGHWNSSCPAHKEKKEIFKYYLLSTSDDSKTLIKKKKEEKKTYILSLCIEDIYLTMSVKYKHPRR